MTLQPRPSILTVEPYVGGESKILGVNRILKLSSNEGPFGPPPKAIEAMVAAAREAHRYPDGGAKALREAIGQKFGLDPARIICGNGSDELLSLLILAYGGEGTELVMSAHGFLMYDITGRWAGCRVIKVPEIDLCADVDGILRAVGPRTRMVFLANPNNPTGSILAQSEVERLRAGLPDDVLLVLDAAYAEYVTRPDYNAGEKLVDATTNTVMCRTFSKVFGLGGMRLGWAYAPVGIADVMNRVRGPFNVNAAAMAAGIGALAEDGWIEKSVAHNNAERARVGAALTAAGFHVYPSEGNFLLVGFGDATRAKAADAALKARGAIVRMMGSYGLPQCLRISIGLAEENTVVIEALTAFAHGG
ncbi:histidinol-phosphate transaminase [Humitalea sp. 24SJ18S-53]|uniref:histidinol-phosphate transaminase n=1 Tax=Humitalea sp. 24SJ18S-53 TaxID=3422307 RepID=UPI003D66D821